MTSWFPRRLTPAQLEERRQRAADLLESGHSAQAEIGRRLHVTRAAVCQWAAILAREGRRGLRRRPRPGRPPRLTPRQWPHLSRLLSRGAVAAGFDTERWTLPRIAAVIRRTVGVRYHPRSLGPALRTHGFTPQRPVTQSRERDEALVRAWLTRDWPRVKKGLVEAGASWPSWTRRVTRFGPP